MFTFSQFHNKNPVAGSTNIRVNQLMKYWEGSGLYKYGENPEVLIFQKVYISEDYKFPAHFKGVKILDICDPDWLDGHAIVETCHAMDAVTCPTESLAAFLRQFHKNVHVVPDRFDLDVIAEPKVHTDTAKTVVWFGYSHNAVCLKPAIEKIVTSGLHLIVISDDDPMIQRWTTLDKDDFYTFIKYDEATIYKDLQRADFALLPDGTRPIDVFKSNNKTIKANLAGLPVAKTAEDMDKYMSAEKRRAWFKDNYETIKAEYDVRKSVGEMKAIIEACHGV
jgi:hypothetical protein